MIGSMFIYGGLDSFRSPGGKTTKAAPIVNPLAETLDLTRDTETWIRANGAVQVVAGAALVLGRLPRLAALTLAATLIPTTLAGHRFWEESDPSSRATQTIHFLKNVSMLGGLLLAADDTGGRPSIPWRIHRATSQAIEHLPVLESH